MTHRNQGFEVLVVLRDVGYVMLSHFPLVHHVEIGASIAVLTGWLEGLSERSFETAVTGRSEGQGVWRVGHTTWDRFEMVAFLFRYLTFVPREFLSRYVHLELAGEKGGRGVSGAEARITEWWRRKLM